MARFGLLSGIFAIVLFGLGVHASHPAAAKTLFALPQNNYSHSLSLPVDAPANGAVTAPVATPLGSTGVQTGTQAAGSIAAPAVPTIMPLTDQLQTLISGSTTPVVAPVVNPPAATAPASAATNAAAPAVTLPLQAPAPTSVAPTGSSAPAGNNVVGAASKSDLSEDTNEAPQDTFGTRALGLAVNDLDYLRAQAHVFIANFSAWQDMSDWVHLQLTDKRHQQFWLTVAEDIPQIVGIPLAGAIIVDLLMLRLVNNLRQRHPEQLAHRLWLILSLLLIKIVPLFGFILGSLGLLDLNEPHRVARFVILSIIYALSVGRFTIIMLRAMLAPATPQLRFLPITSPHAVTAYRLLRSFSLVIISGYFFIDVAQAVHVPQATIGMFGTVLGFVVITMAMVTIVRKRAFVATLLRGNLSAARPNLTPFQSLRLWFARSWHILAIAYLSIGFIVATLGVDHGFTLMLRGTIVTILLLYMLRFLLQAIDRWVTIPANASPGAWMHRSVIGMMIKPVLWVLVLLLSLEAWGFRVGRLFTTPLGQRILGGAFSLSLTLVAVTVIYELFNYVCEKHLNRIDDEGNPIAVSARTRTLLPMLRNTVFIVFLGVVILVALSEVGINIGPLLAGAGVVGVAIGFGSQTLVKDFLTGLFIVLENTIAIGDVVKIGDHSGVVEAMSIRTLRLRDENGALHILPFSEVTQIVNMTKDFAYAVIDMSVAYDSNLDHVMKTIRAVGEDLQKDPIFKRVVLEPIEILGVEKLGDSSITIRSRIRTRAGKQWDIKRWMLLRLKSRFEDENIEIPFPTIMHLQRPPNAAATTSAAAASAAATTNQQAMAAEMLALESNKVPKV